MDLFEQNYVYKIINRVTKLTCCYPLFKNDIFILQFEITRFGNISIYQLEYAEISEKEFLMDKLLLESLINCIIIVK